GVRIPHRPPFDVAQGEQIAGVAKWYTQGP
ncbi:MAG: hypothetical protein UU16_C0060G0001, partial [Candidatus Woesebacteria bacterium GW2011_GWA2_40_7]